MRNWTKDQLREFENRRASSSAKPEPAICHDPLGSSPGEVKDSGRVVVRVTSYRTRLLDPDNLAGGSKYFIDGCRYAGLIPGDRPDQIELKVRQVKVGSKREERTEIELFFD